MGSTNNHVVFGSPRLPFEKRTHQNPTNRAEKAEDTASAALSAWLASGLAMGLNPKPASQRGPMGLQEPRETNEGHQIAQF